MSLESALVTSDQAAQLRFEARPVRLRGYQLINRHEDRRVRDDPQAGRLRPVSLATSCMLSLVRALARP